MSKGFFESVKDSAKHYWSQIGESGSGFSDFAKNLFSSTKANWGEVLGQMSKLYGNADASEALLERLLGQGKSFMSLLEQAYRSKIGDKLDFSALAKSTLEQLSAQNPFASAFAGMGANPFQGAAFAKAFEPGAFDFSQFALPQFLDFPAFGLAREHQERQIELFKHLKAHQAANQRYNELSAQSMQAGIERMRAKLAERSEPGRALDSLKAVYDLWIDSLEEAFAETALSPEYQDAYADLVDTQMRVRASIQKQIELQCAQLGMPTRGEIDSVHKKLAEMRRERHQNSDVSAELAALRAEIAELKAERTPRAKAPAATKRAGPKIDKKIAQQTAKSAAPKRLTQTKLVKPALLSQAQRKTAAGSKAAQAKAIARAALKAPSKTTRALRSKR
jgi:polyhydroxyalkanoate synthase subunit PhaE